MLAGFEAPAAKVEMALPISSMETAASETRGLFIGFYLLAAARLWPARKAVLHAAGCGVADRRLAGGGNAL
jgi:hypothetical protein